MTKVVMMTTDQKLDRRIVLEARTLCRIGYRVTILAAPWPERKETYGNEPFELIRLGESLASFSINGNTGYSASIYRLYHWIKKRGFVLNPYISFIRSVFRGYMSDLERFYLCLFQEAGILAGGDIYHIHDLQPLAAGAVAAEKLRAKLVHDSHELFAEQEFLLGEKRKWQQIEKRYIHRADRVITVNGSIAKELEKRYGIARPMVISNCESQAQRRAPQAEIASLAERLALPPDSLVLLYQGGLSPNRNLENLVRSMSYVRDPRAVLVILGNGELRGKLLHSVKKLNLGNRVFLIPGVPQEELLSVTVQASLGIIPYTPTCLNTFYCTPNKLFEYIAAGIPLLVSDLPELRKIVDTYDIGWVADLTTPQKIAEAINCALLSAEELKKRRKNATLAFKTLCWEEEEKKLIRVYEEL